MRWTNWAGWLGDEFGGIAPTLGVVLTVLFAMSGAAIDFGRAHSKRTQLQAAVDAAALAAARSADASVAQRKAAGQTAFNSNYADYAAATLKVEVSDSDRVNVSVQETVATYLLGVVGKKTIDLNVAAEVPIPKRGYAEIVLVLDYSDSMMDSDKYKRMSEAAGKMIDRISDDGKNTNVKFALVPFSAVVRADIPAAHLRSDVTFDGCTMDRRFPYNTQEGVTPANDAGKWGDHSAGGHDCSVVAAANLKVLPLTSDVSAVKSTLNSFQPHMWTHIAAGAEFGWQVISPDGVFGGARAYTDKHNVKAVILLTDGMQTAPGWGPSDSRTVADAEANLRSICNGMKAKNIEVYTVGYDLTDSHTLSLLQDCAVSGGHYASTDVDSGLMTILASVAKRIEQSMVRLAK